MCMIKTKLYAPFLPMNVCVFQSSKALSYLGGRNTLTTVVVFQDDKQLSICFSHPMRKTAGLALRLIFLSAEMIHLDIRMLHHREMNMKVLASSSSCGDSCDI